MLVEVHAAGLNPIDNITTGMFKPVLKFKLPAVMGSDLAGVVVEVGSSVTRFKPGDTRSLPASLIKAPDHSPSLR
jgi:NADPH:quinone reductase-like Zn-dependent oxidoreductase